MSGRLFGILIAITFLAGPAACFEVGAVLRKLDAERGAAIVFAGGQERSLKFADDAKYLDEDGKDLSDGIASAELKVGTTVTLKVERVGDRPTITSIRIGGKISPPYRPAGPAQTSVGKGSVGFTPLDEMTADDRYKGEDGGLYGGGHNELPDSLRAAAKAQTERITPLNEGGEPDTNGKIGLVSISMSNATQEFSRFKQIADDDSVKSSHVAIVDCAQGGQTMARWADPEANCWAEADRRLNRAGVARQQIQVAWVKLANARPSGKLSEHGKQLQQDTQTVLANLHKHFPNLRIAYLGSRIYGGWADGNLNPEPYAYEGAFVVRWLIKDQLDSVANATEQPLLLWGPYFWADGLTPRKSDGLVWERSDLVGDGTHPSNSGRQKVAEQLLKFFKTDEYTQAWFTKRSK